MGSGSGCCSRQNVAAADLPDEEPDSDDEEEEEDDEEEDEDLDEEYLANWQGDEEEEILDAVLGVEGAWERLRNVMGDVS